ncbi:hypothetical protein KIN20_011678 [Parelaphostrongylus tenuis]|uniref:NADP-dependent oxidoreductase domain-containing protein n=1 Tax=Parelaphostrongylus tenuis TaxID=148309 RepID=A0AAD5MEE8_PARTN|nr:hypothetical protein KIN20_011678 [Parelaphostrongylus tenuis]
MQYRRLGQTEMIVSKISFGSAPISGMFGNVDDSITQIVETALRNGINFIDTAYWYGHARSESILGKVLSKIPRRAYYISTKMVGPPESLAVVTLKSIGEVRNERGAMNRLESIQLGRITFIMYNWSTN